MAWTRIAIRMKNIFIEGDVSYWGEQLHAVGLKETLVKATEAIDWGKPAQQTKPGVKIGKGFACIQKPTRSPTTSNAGVTVNAQGEVTVLAGTVEIGQGCNTILSQVAAEELKVPMEKVRMHQLDTDVIPYDASTTSSRSTYHMGNAVRSAAIHARKQIMEAASPMLEAKVPDLDYGDGKVFLKDQPQQALPIGEVVKRKLGIHGVVRGDASYTYEIGKDLDLETGHSDHASAFYMYATQAAEVAVDEESGRVRLLRMSAAHDVGKAINPLNCVAQIEGGVAMGIGSALHEEMVIDKTGKVRNPSFLDYHLVTSLDVPKMIPIIVECPEPEGPYGAKGLGEPGLAPTPAAIGNAVADAFGVRVYDLPLKPENVYWAIREQEEKRRRLKLHSRKSRRFRLKFEHTDRDAGRRSVNILVAEVTVNKPYQRFYRNLVVVWPQRCLPHRFPTRSRRSKQVTRPRERSKPFRVCLQSSTPTISIAKRGQTSSVRLSQNTFHASTCPTVAPTTFG